MRLKEFEQLGIYIYDTKSQLQRHVYRRSEQAFDLGDRDRDALSSPAEVEARQRAIRETFLRGIGGLPPSDHPLNARTVGVIEETGLRVEKVIFESRPHTYVTANLYLPTGGGASRAAGGRGPAVLFLCGHHEMAKHHPEYQTVCRYLAAAGLVVLAQDPIGQGERMSYYEPSLRETTVKWGTAEHDYAGRPAFLTGTSLARYFLHDAMRGFDYLASRPEVDPARIGVTGNSGGGTQTSLMLLGDPRIAAAAPATFIMNRRSYLYAGHSQDAEQIWPGMSAAGFDHEDILLAGAPKPILVLAVSWDFFPIEGVRRTVERSKPVWGLYGKEADVDICVDESIHMYTPRLAIEAARFFARHLGGRHLGGRHLGGRHLGGLEPDLTGTTVRTIDPAALWCTREGQVRAEFPDAIAVFEETRELSRSLAAGRGRASAGSRAAASPPAAAALEWLRERVVAHRAPCPLNERRLGVHVADAMRVSRYLWWSQPDIFCHGMVIAPLDAEPVPDHVRIALWDGGTTALASHLAVIKETIAGGEAVFVLDVTGTGPMTPHAVNPAPVHEFYGTLFKLNDDLLWLDDCLAAMRTWDVTRAIDLLDAVRGRPTTVSVYSEGRQGTYGILAAAVDPRLSALHRGPGLASFRSIVEERHYDETDITGLIIPGMLRHLDLDEIEPAGGGGEGRTR